MARPPLGVFVEAITTVIAVRVALPFLPLTSWDGLARRLHPRQAAARIDSDDTSRATVRAVRRVARLVPGATCLVQAIAARLLLSRRGHSPRLCIGVMRGMNGQPLRAHAWLENDGVIVIGNRGSGDFTPLWSTESGTLRCVQSAS